MQNTPYESDTSGFPQVVGLGLVTAGVFGLYKYSTDDKFKDTVHDKLNSFSTMRKDTSSQSQLMVEKTFSSMDAVRTKAYNRNNALMDVREEDRSKFSKFSYDAPKSWSNIEKSKTYAINSLDDITDIDGNSIGKDLAELTAKKMGINPEDLLKQSMGDKETGHFFNGTSLGFRVANTYGVDEFELPTQKLIGETWVNYHNGSASAGKLTNIINKNGDKLSGIAVNTNTLMAHALSTDNYIEALYHSKGGTRQKTAARDILKNIDVSATIGTVEKINEARKLNIAMKTLVEGSTVSMPIGALDTKGASVSRQITLDFASQQLHELTSPLGAGASKYGNDGSSSDSIYGLTDYYKNVRDTKKGLSLGTYDRKSGSVVAINKLNTAGEVLHKSILDNIAFIGSQSQTGYGTVSSELLPTDYFAPETAKSMKNLYFANPESKRTKPLYWKKGLDQRSPAMKAMKSNGGMVRSLTIVDPLSDEMIALGSNLYSSKVEGFYDFKVDRLARSNDDKSLQDIFVKTKGKTSFEKKSVSINEFLNSPDELKEIDSFMFPKGTVVGSKNRSDTVNSKEDYLRLKSSPDEHITSPYDMTFNVDEFLELNRGKSEDSSFIFSGKYSDKMIKVGIPGGATRGSTVDASNNLNFRLYQKAIGSSKNLHVPESAISANMYKNILPLMGNGQKAFGKGGGEYLTFLRSSIAGHVYGYNKNINISGKALETLGKYIDLPTENMDKYELSKEARSNGGMQFLDDGLNNKNQVSDLEQLLSTIRSHVTGNKDNININSLDSSSKSETYLTKQYNEMFGGELPDYLKDADQKAKDQFIKSRVVSAPWLLDNPYSPQESEGLTIGKGEGILRTNAMDMSLTTNLPHSMAELNLKNTVDSIGRMESTNMMMLGLQGNLTNDAIKSYEDRIGSKLDLLEGSELGERFEELLEPGITHNLKNPDTYLNSIFSKEKNPNGFLFKMEIGKDNKQGIGFFPGHDFWGGAQYVPDSMDKGSMALRDYAYDAARIMQKVSQGDGTLRGSSLKEFQVMAGQNYVDFVANNEMKSEGALYGKLVNSQFLTDAERRLSAIGTKEADDLNYLTGSVSLHSRQSYTNVVSRDLENAIRTAETKTKSGLINELDSLYGTNNHLSQMVQEFGGSTDRKMDTNAAREIAGEGAQKSSNIWKQIKTQISNHVITLEGKAQENKFAIQDIQNKMFKNGIDLYAIRYPNLYANSALKSMAFVDDELEKTRSWSAGHVIQTLFHGDTDGDAMKQMMMYSQAAREETLEQFMINQRVSYNFMRNLKEGNILSTLNKGISKGGFTAVGSEYTPQYNKFIGLLEREGAAAAVVTKSVTGMATVKSWGQTGYYERMLSQNKELTKGTYDHARSFINTFIPATGPQDILSAKHLKMMTERTSEGINLLSSMDMFVKGIGSSDDKMITQNVRSAGEINYFMQQAIIDSRSKLNKGKMSEELSTNLDSMFNMQTGWRRLDDKELDGVFDLLHGGSNASLSDFKNKYAKEAERVSFISENKTLQDSGILTHNALDFLGTPIHKGSKASENYFAAIKTVMNTMNKSDSIDSLETSTLKMVTDSMSHWKSAFGSDSFVNDSLRRATSNPEHRVYPMLEKTMEFIQKHATPKNLGVGAGAALLAFTAMNLLSGDGTPEDINDLPSYNNPSFSNNKYNNMGARRQLEGSYQTNVSSSLLTDHRTSNSSLMGHIGNLVGLRGYNASISVSDGSNPYLSDMHNLGS